MHTLSGTLKLIGFLAFATGACSSPKKKPQHFKRSVSGFSAVLPSCVAVSCGYVQKHFLNVGESDYWHFTKPI